jgi:tetratricopeptide (TPR) repeat protein
MDALKKKFMEGHHAEAIAECEALCQKDPNNRELKRLCAMMQALTKNYGRALELLHELRDAKREDADILFNIGMCEKELRNFTVAREYFRLYTSRFPRHSDGWVGLAECHFELGVFGEGITLADQAIKIDSTSVPAWAVRGNCQKSMGQYENALASYKKANQICPTVECWLKAGQTFIEMYKPSEAIDCFTHAIKLAPNLASVRVARGDTFAKGGKLQEAVADFKVALRLASTDTETLKKACICLLTLHQGSQAIELCDEIIRAQPSTLAAKLVREWVLSQLVPAWHVPMMNEQERNKAYYDALASVVTPEKVVFEIGTGSGLIAMMAAKLGAKKIFTCEAIDLIADTATRIIKRNNYQDKITVFGKHSHSVQLEKDLPVKADILVHEIFSSDLLGEHLISAIEDAKDRLLKADGRVLPSAASIMIGLVGGDELGRHLHVEESFGFDLRDFNVINGKRNPLFRYDLATVLLSDDVEAFRFDFDRQMTFPAETRVIRINSTGQGLCYGIIQWIRIELGEDMRFENHPSRHRPVANWQNIVHRFDEPIYLEKGSVVSVTAAHNQLQPWFELTSYDGTP